MPFHKPLSNEKVLSCVLVKSTETSWKTMEDVTVYQNSFECTAFACIHATRMVHSYMHPQWHTHHNKSALAISLHLRQHAEAWHKEDASRYKNIILAISFGSCEMMSTDKSCFRTYKAFRRKFNYKENNCRSSYDRPHRPQLWAWMATDESHARPSWWESCSGPAL